eukprot:TRINITY_DN16230_c0_g1_i1.p1 TRINITY_DN16230_c0_g1~~TRINITY_DN16230_c0_g1_i1.p1  ORF type:complete len:269 (+),score=96.87 TRINITY_DN16230_c0_g1_i1:78-884(+)
MRRVSFAGEQQTRRRSSLTEIGERRRSEDCCSDGTPLFLPLTGESGCFNFDVVIPDGGGGGGEDRPPRFASLHDPTRTGRMSPAGAAVPPPPPLLSPPAARLHSTRAGLPLLMKLPAHPPPAAGYRALFRAAPRVGSAPAAPPPAPPSDAAAVLRRLCGGGRSPLPVRSADYARFRRAGVRPSDRGGHAWSRGPAAEAVGWGPQQAGRRPEAVRRSPVGLPPPLAELQPFPKPAADPRPRCGRCRRPAGRSAAAEGGGAAAAADRRRQ